jgi:hypothetical protein
MDSGNRDVQLPDDERGAVPSSGISRRPNGGMTLSVPHIRLDRAMQFLFGDRLA